MAIEPIYGWAAVCPNGGNPQIEFHTLSTRRREACANVSNWLFRRPEETHAQGWRRAYRQGWRLIRVQISPAFDRQAPRP